MSKKIKKSTKKVKRVRHYGLTKLAAGQKFCFISQENVNGWSLGLSLDNRTVWLTNVRFASMKDVKLALRGSAVFIGKKKAAK